MLYFYRLQKQRVFQSGLKSECIFDRSHGRLMMKKRKPGFSRKTASASKRKKQETSKRLSYRKNQTCVHQKPSPIPAADLKFLHQKQFLNKVFDQIRDGISILDHQLGILYVNDTMKKWYAHALPLIGKKCYEAYHGRKNVCEICPTRQTLKTGESCYEMIPKIGPSGKVAGWFDLFSSPIKDPKSQRIIGVIEYVRDITEQKKIQEALLENERKYRSIFESAAYGILLVNQDGKIIDCNQQSQQLLGYTMNELIGQSFKKIFHPEQQSYVQLLMGKIFKEGSAHGQEYTLINKNGALFSILMNATALRDRSGHSQQALCILHDITARKNFEQALAESENKYRTILENSGTAVLIIEDNTVISFANHEFCSFVGFPKSEIENKKSWTEFVYREDLETIKNYHRLRRIDPSLAPRQYEFRLQDKYGNLHYVLNTVCLIPNTHQSIWSIIEITELKKAEEKTRTALAEKVILLKEIQQRVNNNLQIITHLLDLQSKSLTDPHSIEVFKESQNRIQSMAFIHESLYRSKNLSSIDFADYSHDLIKHLFQSYRINPEKIRLGIEVQSQPLPVNTAMICGLLLNELISNCLKYAFPNDRTGDILISLKASPTRKGILKIKDTGIGFPNSIYFDEAKTLGLQLIKAFVKELEGSIELHIDQGTEFIIEFPL